MESADARTALLSAYLSRNSETKSVPPSPSRNGNERKGGSTSRLSRVKRPLLKRPTVDRFGAGGLTIYGMSKACPTLAALARIEAKEEEWRTRLLEAQLVRMKRNDTQGDSEMAEADEMFRMYIDLAQCSDS